MNNSYFKGTYLYWWKQTNKNKKHLYSNAVRCIWIKMKIHRQFLHAPTVIWILSISGYFSHCKHINEILQRNLQMRVCYSL